MTTTYSCSNAAIRLFEKQTKEIDSNDSVYNAALAIALHSFDDLDFRMIRLKIEQITNKITARVNGKSAKARIAHLHQVLFFEEGYIANVNRQASHLLDSFLPTVIELKVGSPEIIGLIYKVIAAKIGLDVDAVVYDDRMFIRLHDGHGWLLVDLFKQNTLHFGTIPTPIERLPSVPNREWIRRMLLRNMTVLELDGYKEDYAAMEELLALLDTKPNSAERNPAERN